MAKGGILKETDPFAGKAKELKKELQKLVKEITDKDDYKAELANDAIKVLCSLQELYFKKKQVTFKDCDNVVPVEFKCPISGKIMSDPVVLASVKTYDRPFIQRWLNEGNRTCPLTEEVLSHIVLTPNQLVHDMISQWCNDHGLELPKPFRGNDEDVITDADHGHLKSLLAEMSSIPDLKNAARKLRLLTERRPSFRPLCGDHATIDRLLNPVSVAHAECDPDFKDDLITIFLNISICDDNKSVVAEDPRIIPLLIDALQNGNDATRSNAAAALSALSQLDKNRLIIGKAGALKPLIDLLKEGHPVGMKDAAAAILGLCFLGKNKKRLLHDGGVTVIMEMIMERKLVGDLLGILARLSDLPKAVEEMVELGAVPCLLSIIRESEDEVNKEMCLVILLEICMNDKTKSREEIKEDEDANSTLYELAENVTSRVGRTAKGILESLYIE
ncbi:U-box domain-containing protein [Cephalotus follicularis]|uniref:RING-type E3 ubiquitin transferase n=1 Tax=Cephalotus follicularis TaxID=3775 RepID=A0A1Q3BPB6_CEPFO|nr:U-box domain-containing protein [Cephalotus follicularis]